MAIHQLTSQDRPAAADFLVKVKEKDSKAPLISSVEDYTMSVKKAVNIMHVVTADRTRCCLGSASVLQYSAYKITLGRGRKSYAVMGT